MGSGGTYIGYQVAKELGFNYVNREILRQAAERLGTDKALLQEYEQKSSSLIQNIIKVFSFGTPEVTAYIPKDRPIYNEEVFAVESRIINEIANTYNAVIMGRGAFHVLKNRPQAVHILIYAPSEFRISRVIKAATVTKAQEVRMKIEESDQERAKFIKDMTRTVWTDARNYHLCIDSSAIGLSTGIKMIVRLVEQKRSDWEA